MAQLSLSTVSKDAQGTVSSSVCKFGESKVAVEVFMSNNLLDATVVTFMFFLL